VADLLEAGAEPATARSRYLSLRRSSTWLAEERELLDDPLVGSKVTPSLRPNPRRHPPPDQKRPARHRRLQLAVHGRDPLTHTDQTIDPIKAFTTSQPAAA
jgi:hypothetical protein